MTREERAEADLTARARIRDAALRQFAELGVERATIRGIAEEAGVSPGLVQHHFRSKNALREACDAYAFDTLWTNKDEALEGGLRNPDFLARAASTSVPVQRYIARSLVDGSEAAKTLFGELVDVTETYLRDGAPGISPAKSADLRARAAVMTGMHSGLMVLHEHMSRVLGVDVLTPAGYARIAQAFLEIYTDNIFEPGLVEDVRAAVDRFAGQEDFDG